MSDLYKLCQNSIIVTQTITSFQSSGDTRHCKLQLPYYEYIAAHIEIIISFKVWQRASCTSAHNMSINFYLSGADKIIRSEHTTE